MPTTEQSAISAYIKRYGITPCTAGATTKQATTQPHIPSRAATTRDLRDLYGDAFKPFHAINNARAIERTNLINKQRQARLLRGGG